MWSEWFSSTATERFMAKMQDDIRVATETLASPDVGWDKVQELRGRISALRGAILWAKERSKEAGDGED